MRDSIRQCGRIRQAQGRRVRDYLNVRQPLGPYQVSIAGPARGRLLMMLSEPERELLRALFGDDGVAASIDREIRHREEAA